MRGPRVIFSSVWAVAAVFACFAAVVFLSEFVAVDGCLDRGGSYDYVAQTCDFTVSHEYVPFGVRHPILARGFPVGIIGVVGGVFVVLWRRAERS